MFKEGDKVVCVENKDLIKYLTIGKVYTVSKAHTNYVSIISDDKFKYDFFQYRFRLSTLLEKELAEC